MISGRITRKIRMEIRSIIDECASIEEVWGFGSYFRGGCFNDVDILVIIDCERDRLMAMVRHLRERFLELGRELGLKLGLLILTPKEFAERPLRDMDQLILLGSR